MTKHTIGKRKPNLSWYDSKGATFINKKRKNGWNTPTVGLKVRIG